jgi:bacillithiol biosynthesis cysteine-adding enzyme BshC
MNKIPRFQRRTVPFRTTGHFSKLVLDYLDESADLKPFYSRFSNIQGIKEQLESFKNYSYRSILVSSLENQYKSAGLTVLNKAVSSNIELLKEKNTFTVTTGHQLNLFSGPLYVLYKLATTIRLAEELKKAFPENNFVPVYWMASEDHDIEEINSISLFNKKVEYKTDYNGPAGKLRLKDFNIVTDELEKLSGDSENARDLIQLIRQCYQQDDLLVHATMKWVNHFFGKYGLVVIDPDDISLKKCFISEIKEELTNQTSFHKVSETINELAEKNYNAQVQPREINLFYLHDDKRTRIVLENNRYQILDSTISFSKDEILKDVEQHP